MKGFALTMLGLIFICGSIFAQTYDRRYHPDYMWTSLDEDFSEPHLDRSIWQPAKNFKRGLGFLVDTALTVNVNKGNLELKMQHAPRYIDSIWHPNGWKPIFSNYIGGEFVTLKRFSFGVFECKAKYALKSGSWPAFWLYGNEDVPCPPGAHDSEIDMAELNCDSDFPTMMHVIHRYDPPANCDESNQRETDKKSYSVPRRPAYSIYKCVWTPERIQYFVNNKLMHEVINQNYEWFPSIPLNLILSQQVTQGYDMANEVKPVTPQTTYFDWVKVRQFFLAPEITCPDSITSEATATLDVDPLASQITWQLSPAELFTTSKGTGKTASIVRAVHTNGPAKITYTFQMPSGETFTAEKTFE